MTCGKVNLQTLDEASTGSRSCRCVKQIDAGKALAIAAQAIAAAPHPMFILAGNLHFVAKLPEVFAL